jgi:hypothetical protein
MVAIPKPALSVVNARPHASQPSPPVVRRPASANCSAARNGAGDSDGLAGLVACCAPPHTDTDTDDADRADRALRCGGSKKGPLPQNSSRQSG